MANYGVDQKWVGELFWKWFDAMDQCWNVDIMIDTKLNTIV